MTGYWTSKYSVRGGELRGQRFESQGFNTVADAEAHYQGIMSALPDGYVFTEADLPPERSYAVCPKCGGIDTVQWTDVENQKARKCEKCPYQLLLLDDREGLKYIARKLGVRGDWHEPDEQGITIRVQGSSFDNAGFWPTGFGESYGPHREYHVVIEQDGEDVAAVNLATLFAIASDSRT